MESITVCDWTRWLDECRELSKAQRGVELWQHFQRHKEHIEYQLQAQSSIDVNKTEFLQKRKALRLALSYLSLTVVDDGAPCHSEKPEIGERRQLRHRIQEEGYNVWFTLLVSVLLTPDMDRKCRQLASQTLCNLVTDCPHTARRIVERDVGFAPSSEKSRVSRIHVTHHPDEGDKSIENSITTEISWVDLMLASASFRPALAGLVASLHNSLASLLDSSILEMAASSPLLVSTLLRQLVSAQSVQQATNSGSSSTTTTGFTDPEWTDEATEWIVLTLSLLARAGFLQHMYLAVACRSIKEKSLASSSVLPEQVVLLHCVRTSVEEYHHSDMMQQKNGKEETVECRARFQCLGGVSAEDDKSCAKNTILFLIELYLLVRDENLMKSRKESLEMSVLQLILDILGEVLSEDSTAAATVREAIGSETTLIQVLLTDVGAIYDLWNAQNNGIHVRDQVALSNDQQLFVTSSVRVLGNFCFRCPHNQDLLRTTIVPSAISLPLEKNSDCSRSVERNGLHLLLSTTSMSFACFTLREWAVVAIRNALDNNNANQLVVAELEARSAVQSAALDDLGLCVDMDRTREHVKISADKKKAPKEETS